MTSVFDFFAQEFSRNCVIYMKSHDVTLFRIEKPAGEVSP
jgi:hypothetical protein